MHQLSIVQKVEAEAFLRGFGRDAGLRDRFRGHGPGVVRADAKGNLFAGIVWDAAPGPDAEQELGLRLAACTDALFHAVLDLERRLTITIVAVTAVPYAGRAMGGIMMDFLESRGRWFNREGCEVEERREGLSWVFTCVSLSPESLECA